MEFCFVKVIFILPVSVIYVADILQGKNCSVNDFL